MRNNPSIMPDPLWTVNELNETALYSLLIRSKFVLPKRPQIGHFQRFLRNCILPFGIPSPENIIEAQGQK